MGFILALLRPRSSDSVISMSPDEQSKYSIIRIIDMGFQEQRQTIPGAVNHLALWQIPDVHAAERGPGGRGSETVFRLSFLSNV